MGVGTRGQHRAWRVRELSGQEAWRGVRRRAPTGGKGPTGDRTNTQNLFSAKMGNTGGKEADASSIG